MRKLSVLIALSGFCLLAACAPGRWVVNDLSSYSYKFGPVAASKPFARNKDRLRLPAWHADTRAQRQHAVRRAAPGQ